METGTLGLLTIAEIASELRTSKGWVYSRTRQGQTGIPHLKIGKQLRFKKDEVLKFFEAAREKTNV